MNTQQEISLKSKAPVPLLEKDHGYFHSATIAVDPDKVFEFCQDAENVKKVLTDLPLNVDNFLNLNLISATETASNQYKIQWSNKPNSRLAGNVIFLITKAPSDRGTYLTAEASFDKVSFKDESPSFLMNVFLKRFKALMETGEIPTVKGQPSGREELKLH